MFVPHEPTEDDFEAHLAVNHLAHFLLFRELKERHLRRERIMISLTSRLRQFLRTWLLGDQF